jgi:hypothetical protein
MHPVHLGTGLFGSTKRQSSTKMSGSVRLDRRLVDTPHTPWDTSVVTCNTDQADTNFAHRFDLPRVSSCNAGLFCFDESYQSSPIFPGTQLLALDC